MSTKSVVLELLEENAGSAVSGELIAKKTGVSRAAVWKAVNSLRNAGYVIQGNTNGGYILEQSNDVFNKESMEFYLAKNFPQHKDSNINFYESIDSTNNQAKRILAECGALRDINGNLTSAGHRLHKSVYVAEQQTAGKGRLGRTFCSPKKTGIYLSIIYAPSGGITKPARLTAFAAVAVCRAVKKLYGVECSIKWVNDVFANGKKICGILTEGVANLELSCIESAVIGIGVNICDAPEFNTDELKSVVGSIAGTSAHKDFSIKRSELASEIIGQCLDLLESPENAIEEYRSLSFIIGQTIDVCPVIGEKKSIYKAKAIDIDEDACLVVELKDGSKKHLNSGEVSLRAINFALKAN